MKNYSLLSIASEISCWGLIFELLEELETYFDDKYRRAFKQALFEDSIYVDPFPLRGFSVSGKIERFT